MSYYLTHLIQHAIEKIGPSAYMRCTATGGSTTTFACSTLTRVGEVLNGGLDGSIINYDFSAFDLLNATCIIVKDAGDAGASPEGKMSLISAYNPSTKTGTIAGITDAVGAGDELMLVFPTYPLSDMIRLANGALKSVGRIALSDTSITTEDEKTEYALPAHLEEDDILRLFLQTNDDDSDNNAYTPLRGYKIYPSAAGVASTLVFPFQPVAGLKIRIDHLDYHPTVDSYNDPIHESIPQDLLETELAWQFASWRNADQSILQRLYNERTYLRERRKIETPAPHGRGIVLSSRTF
jgi:hypothetical protein